MNTISGYKQIAVNLERSLKSVAARPEVARETAYYLAHIRDVKSIDEFIKDERLFGFAMKAFGLKDMAYGKAFMRKVLAEGVDGKSGFALQLADARFREFAETFNFSRYGATATAFTRTQQGTVDKYLRVELEDQAATSSEGVRLALYFQRKAPEVSSIYGLMADRALFKVVQTALDLPSASSKADIDKLAALIGSKIDIATFKDEAALSKFITRFAARWQALENIQAPPPQIALALPAIMTLPNSTMLTLQLLKKGRT